jgi:4-hydroxy-tetrahydrodipicolinate synthase
MKKNFTGTGVALVTPFHKYGTIDFGALEKIIEHTIAGGVDYLVVLGTTGEAATLSQDEKGAVVDFVVETTDKRIPVVKGIGGNNTQEILNVLKCDSFEGIDAILSVTPYYNKPQQKGLYNHFKLIASASPVPVILYNVPSRTGSNLSSETTLQLAHDFNNIVAIKEASGDFQQIAAIIKDKPAGFKVISGDDNLTLPLMAIGAEGVISVTANAFPAEFSKMISLALKGDFKSAAAIHYSLLKIMETLFEDGSPAGVKAALQILEIAQSHLRLPLVRINKSIYIKLNALISDYILTQNQKLKK